MQVLVGTSGWSYAPWRGSFYPEKLPTPKMLSHYAGRLRTVEVNNTFYKMPTESLLEGWASEVPDGFSFAIKSPQRITHQQRLVDAADSIDRLATVLKALGTRLGPILFQLPPFLRKDVPRLVGFLETLRDKGAGLRAAFEFRHVSWFSDDVYEALRNAGAALCIAEGESLDTPLVATTTWGYLRLRRETYQLHELPAWAERIRAQPWESTHVFFKHEDAGVGPRLAAELTALLA